MTAAQNDSSRGGDKVRETKRVKERGLKEQYRGVNQKKRKITGGWRRENTDREIQIKAGKELIGYETEREKNILRDEIGR